MIDAAHPAASWFLWLLGSSFLLIYALPLAVAPLAWARVFRWHVVGPDPLTIYFGRCIGAVAVALCAACLRAAPAPAAHPIVLELIALSGATLAIVHVVGLLERSQPWPEHVEILLFSGAAAFAAYLRSGL